ncbi:MAG: hypothetical protein ACXVAS_04220 [Vulcanimicrobiaceae bacterium]
MWKSLAVALALAGALALVPQPAGGAQATYAQLMTALKNGSSEADKFRGMMAGLTAAEFHLVNVQTLLSGNDRAAYQSALKKGATEIADLHETLTHTTLTGDDGIVELLSTMLKKQSLLVAQVVAVHVDGNQITLFYQ